MQIVKRYPLHLFLFAIYPVLTLWVVNIGSVEFYEVWRALLISLGISTISFFLLKQTGISYPRAGLIISLTSVLFFSFGHVLSFLAKATIKNTLKIDPILVFVLWPTLWLVTTWAILRLLKNTELVQAFLNVMAAALVVFSCVQALYFEIPELFTPKIAFPDTKGILNEQMKPNNPAELPDIYYIILDGYGRQDILRKVLGEDNQTLIQGLKDRGFYIADQSTSNYSNTTPSIASSLNFEYINSLTEIMGSSSVNYRPLRELIRHSQLVTLLKHHGYQIITYETGFSLTEIQDSTQYISLQPGPNSFESLLLSNSVAMLWVNQPMAARYRNRITGTFQSLSEPSVSSSPKFVFAHILAAHPPFIFGPNGEAKRSAGSVELDTGVSSDRQAEIQGYRDQVTYINKLVLKMVDGVIKNSTQTPVIIIQGDHGSGVYMDWQSAANTCYKERKAILNAYFFPDQKTQMLYKQITPVNTFRVVLNTYLGTNLTLLEDRNYFSLWNSPYEIEDITGKDGNCPANLR